MISTLMLSTRLTLETAASPTPATMIVSAMPIETERNCSSSSGISSRLSASREKSGARSAVCPSMVFFLSPVCPAIRATRAALAAFPPHLWAD